LPLFLFLRESLTNFQMPLPETIAIRFTEEDAGYVTVRPVVKQVFRLPELVDMVLSVTGKNIQRVQQIFRAGTVVYNGYRYRWEGFSSEISELTALLAPYPDDDPSRPFDAAGAASLSLEIAGGTQRSLIEITRLEASSKRFLHNRSPWEILVSAVQGSALRYEKYSHAHRADLYRLPLLPEVAQVLRTELFEAAPRPLRKRLAGLQPPSALLVFVPRTPPHQSESRS
jgi:hypothetical protein